MERKHLSKSKKIVFLILLLLVIFSVLFIFLKSKVEVNSVNFARKEYNLSEEQSTEIGQNAIISSIVVTKRTTGVGPFDTTDEPGNDSSADNNIVRSFDQVTWTMEANMALKSGATHSNFVGGIVEVKAELPENCTNKVKWNTSSMNWLEGAVVSEDGRTVTGKYELPTTEVSIPGKREYVFILNVLGAENNLELKPTFTFNLHGNEESEKKQLALTKDEDIVKVSATPKYNIELQQNSNTTRATVDYGDGEKEGRMYGISAVLQLINDEPSKGMKGIEIPKGDISFDINLNLKRSEFGSTKLEDITSECTPVLWNYKINSKNKNGNIENRTMDFGNIDFIYEGFHVPLGIKDDKNRDASIYNSGNVKMEQEESVIKTTINGYEFDGIFPKNGLNNEKPEDCRIYENNEGCFSSIYFQIFIPDNEASKQDDKNYYLTIQDTNFNTQSLSNNSITRQERTTDDTLSITHVRYRKGDYTHKIYTLNNKGIAMQQPYNAGNAYINKEGRMFVESYIDINPSNDKDEKIKAVDRFLKFDGEAFEPIKVNDKYYELSEKLLSMQFKMYFVTKKDGSNWKDQTDMNNGIIENMDLYNSLEEIPNGKLCIGVYFESISGEIVNPQSWTGPYLQISLNVKDTAIVNKTYGLVQTSKYWRDELDRSIYTQEKLDSYKDYPKPIWSKENKDYIKTEYDENGDIIPGTHSGGYTHGQTILIIGAEQKINIKTIDEKEDNKINYDFGKNETTATYQISPRIEGTDNKVGNLSGIKIKIKATLPKGLTYIAGSCDYEEPEIIQNENGTTQLVWYKNDCTVNETITPIKYKTEIDQDSLNGVQYETKVEMEEVVGKGQNYKIGNTQNIFRSANKSINIINLASYTLYKTTETPVIEVNGEVHYKITASNRTENPTTEFQLLDILPYKGDGRGTQYSGTYTVNKIEIKQTNLATGEEIDKNKLKLYVTNDESVRNGITAKDEDLGKTSIWTAATSGEMLDKELKAYALIGTIESKSKVEIDIYIQTNGNKPNDVYKNAATAQTNKKTELIETSIVKVENVKREIEGRIWLDKNADGLISEGEEFLPNIKVTLLNEDGTPVINIEKNEILSTVTDENGYYKFEDMVRGNYKVKVEVTNEGQEITSKLVGTDETINSKVNVDGTTDTITKLNELSEPVISVKNINAGIKYKETKVVVHHYEEGTTKELSEDVTIKGRVEDEYKTESAKDIPEYYELIEVPENATGKMTLNPIEITYYYRLKNYSYEVNYLEKNTNKVLETKKTVNDIKYGTQVNSDDEVIEITGYRYDSCDKENITIGMENNVINLYYIVDENQRKELSYTVEYYKNGELVEEDSEKEIQEVQVLEPNMLTVNKEKINIVDKYFGYKLEKTEPEAIPETIEDKGIIKVYYVTDESQQKELSYTVEYYKNGKLVEEDTEREKQEVQVLEPNVLTVNKEKINIVDKYFGYKFEKTEPEAIPETIEDNGIIKVYYVIDDENKKTLSYTVEYYKNGELVEEDTEREIQEVQVLEPDILTVNKEKINIVDKYFGYKFEKTEPEVIPETIENKGIIKVYYVIDDENKKTLSYKVEYYKDGENQEKDTQIVTKEVQILEPNTLEVDKTQINILDKYTGYKLEKVEPETIPDIIENNGVIKIYYIKDNFDYVVEYYYDGIVDESKTEKSNATYQDTITTYTDKVIPGYKLERTENIPLTISEYPLLNVINIYYVKDNFDYTVNYYYDGVIDESKTEKLSATFGDKIESYLDKSKEGYEFEKVENIPLIVTEDSTQNIINVYYVRKEATCIVKYVDKNTGEEISEEVRKTGKILDKFDVAEDEKEIPGYTLVERPNPTTGEYTEETQTKTYYYVKNTKVIVKYLEKDETPEDSTDNNILAEEYIIEGYVGKEYTTDKKDIDNYTFIESTNNTTGKMTDEVITVIYYYLQNTKVIVNHIDKNTGEKLEVIEESGKVGDVYTSNAKDFEGYILVEKPENETVTMTKEEITLNYYYVKISSGVIEKHINFKTGEILEEKLHEGNEGDSYSTSIKDFEGYDVVTNKMYYTEYVKEHPEYLEENEVVTVDELLEKKGLNPEENYIPENYEGIMTVEPIEVKYYYIRKAQIRVEYIDKITGERIQEEKDSTEIITGYEGDEYKTEEKVFEGYDIVKEEYPENTEGIMEVTTDEEGNVVTEIVVKYYYIHKAKVIEKHINIKTEELLEKETVYEGHEGEEYNTKEKEFEGYDIVKEEYPENNKGTMTPETIEVKYYYIRKADVVVEYIDKITGEKMTEIDKETKAEIDSTEKINGHEGDPYKTEEKVFENYVIIKEEYPENSEGTMKVIVNEDGTVNTTTYVRYYYAHVSSGVIEKHIDVITGELIEKEIKYEGHEGDPYSTKSKEFEGYDLVKEKLPKNAEGKMTKEEIEVKYYYIRKAKVIVRYLEKDTNKVLAKEETIDGHEGDKYDTGKKAIEGYNLVEEPKNKTGKMERKDIIVTYYYNKKTEQPKPTTPSKSDTPTTQNKPQQVVQITEQKQTTQNNNVIPTANTTQVKTGDIVPVITIGTIIMVFVLNVLQVLIFRKRKNTN